MRKNKHLTLDDRATIQTELDKGTSFKEIGLILGKDCTTISKEVRKHICRQKTGAMGRACPPRPYRFSPPAQRAVPAPYRNPSQGRNHGIGTFSVYLCQQWPPFRS